MSMRLHILKWVFLVIAVAFVGAIYAVVVSFSDYHEYSSDSILAHLLTPKELTTLSTLCKDNPSFVYRSADGPKPTIVTMNCIIIKHDFEQQMKASGFQYVNSDLFQKNAVQVQVITNPDENKIISITFIGAN